MKNRIRIACLLTSLVSLTAYGQNPWKDKWREMNYATVNGVEIAYDDVGSGEAILLIHGGNVADSFVRMLDEPALTEFRLINMHRRGNGQSSDFREVSTFKQMAEDAIELLEELGIDKAHIVAHSAGGSPALYMAMTAPEMVQSLILVEPSIVYVEGTPEAAELEAGASRFLRRFYEGDPTERAAAWWNMMLGDDWENEVAPLYPHALEQVARGLSLDVELVVQQAFVGKSDFERIQAPVLFVFSEAADQRQQETYEYLLMHIPTLESATAGETHLLQVFDPGPLAAVIADFAAQHPVH